MTTPQHDTILIIDFGSQVTQLIARRVREEGVYSEVVPFQKAGEAFRRLKPKGVILSGSPESVTLAESPRAPQDIFAEGVPVFGICYGQQTMAAQLGGEVEGGHHAEFGRSEIEIFADSPLYRGVWHVGHKYPVWMSHGIRGDFVDYTGKAQVEGRANWTIRVFDTGAMPHFEAEAEFIAAYDSFLAGVPSAVPRAETKPERSTSAMTSTLPASRKFSRRRYGSRGSTSASAGAVAVRAFMRRSES